MIYQIILLCFGAACILGAPTNVTSSDKQPPTIIPIISQSEELESNGTYKFSYETGNGIKREETSYDKVIPKTGRSHSSEEGGDSNESDESDEIHVQQGSYSYTAPDGTLITLRYIADENGFRPIGSHLPRAPSPISTASNEKSARTLKQTDSESSGSVQSSVKSPSEETVPAVVARSAAKPATLEDKPAEIISVATMNDDESQTTTKRTLPIKKSETLSTTTSQSEQKTKVSEPSETASTQSDKTTEPTVTGSHTSPDVNEESSTVAGTQPDETFEPTESGSGSTSEAKTDYSETEDNMNSSTQAVTEELSSEIKDSTQSTSVATNEQTTEPSNAETTLATTVSDNSNTEASAAASTTSIDKDETVSTRTTAEITETVTHETTDSSTSTGAPSSEEPLANSSGFSLSVRVIKDFETFNININPKNVINLCTNIISKL